jgi:trk system potassium uptake protein TrkA
MLQFAVIGMGRFGMAVARTLAQKGAEVLAIDSDPEVVESIKDQVTQAVCLDATNEAAMRAAGLEGVDTAVVAVGESVETSVMATALLSKLGVPRIVARATNELHHLILEEIGAVRVVKIEQEMGEELAKSILAPDLQEKITLTSGHSMAEVIPRPEFVGRSIREIDLRARYGVNLISIQHRRPVVTDQGENRFEVTVNDLPSPDDRIGAHDILVVVGPDEAIERLVSP